MAYIDTKYIGDCETCKHHRSGKCDTWCDIGESYQPDMTKIPTADVVKVVRCKDCKYQDECLQKVDCEYVMKEIVFCSYGERKEK